MGSELSQIEFDSLIESSLAVFVGVTVLLFGSAAWMAGRALALAWKSRRLILPYSLLLGVGSRFITFALFEGRFLSLGGYAVSTLVLAFVMLASHRIYEVRQMVHQYPWMVESAWWFSWREKMPIGNKVR